jgi:hypothetical protein
VFVAILATSAATALAQNPVIAFANQIGSSSTEYPNDIAVDGNGNLYVTGTFRGSLDFDPGAGSAILTGPVTGDLSIFVASYDAAGTYRWAFTMPGAPLGGTNPGGSGRAIDVDAAGNIVVTGSFTGSLDFDPGTGTRTLAAYGSAVFVARYTPTGNHLWSFQIGGGSTIGLHAGAEDVAFDGNGDIIVVGGFIGTMDFNPGTGITNLTSARFNKKPQPNGNDNHDLFVAKYSSAGAYLWAFRLGNQYAESASSVDVDGSGNIYVTGGFGMSGTTYVSNTVDFNPGSGTANLTTTNPAIYVARFSAAGGFAWAFKLAAAPLTSPQRIAIDGNGGVVVAGGFTGTVDFDPGAGTATLIGMSTGSNGDIFVARYASSGAYQWAFTPSVGTAYGLSIDANGDIFVSGSYRGANDFDPDVWPLELSGDPTYPYHGFAASYTSAMTLRWAFSTTGPDIGRAIVSTGSGDVFFAGSFNATSDFDPSAGSATLTTAGVADIFLAKYSEQIMPKPALRPDTGVLDLR